MGGGKKDAPKDAAEAQADAAREGLAELKRQFDISRRDIRRAQQQSRRDLRRAKRVARQDFRPIREVGTRALRRTEEASTVGGLGQRLGQIFEGGALDPLVEERTRAAQGHLGAVGLSRSGGALEEISAIPTELGFQIEQLLAGRQAGLAQQGIAARAAQADAALGTAGAQANISQGVGQTLAGLSQAFGQQALGTQQQIGQAQAQGILGSAQAKSAGLQNIIGTGASIAGLFFSDPRLKTNVVKLAEIKGLGVYQWDWIDEVQDLAVAKTPTLGFMADEVAELRPEYCYEVAGFKCIDYGSLMEKLDLEILEEFPDAA